jgi:ABC-type multidrug transport system permease subunit
MRKTLGTLGQLLLWSLRDYAREPAALFWTLGFPILMTLTLGQMTSQAHGLRANVAVLADAADAAPADAWIAANRGDGSIQWVRMAPAALPAALATGQVRLGVERAWDGPARRWRFDPADSQALLAYHVLRDRLEGRTSDAEPLHVPGARYIDFLLPGLLALGLVNSCLWGVGWGLIELREKRLLRLMLATPLSPGAFFAAQFVGRLLLSVLESAALLAFSALLFHVRVQGSLGALAALWACGVAGFFGVAVLVGSRTARSSVGQGLINAVTIPMFVISGVFFGLDNFPPALQRAFHLFPPTLMVDASRLVMNTPAGWADVAPACLALLAMGAACYGLGRRWFRFY